MSKWDSLANNTIRTNTITSVTQIMIRLRIRISCKLELEVPAAVGVGALVLFCEVDDTWEMATTSSSIVFRL